jgi:Bacterial alpha-L-rhamnosidase 6 hairpin glycosidase domain
MDIAKGLGQSGRVAIYEVPDTELAVGSTLGGPKAMAIIKANGAIEKVYSIDTGETLFGTVILRHYDAVTGMYLAQESPGKFIIHPEHQEHLYSLANKVEVHENIFVLSGHPQEDGTVEPPAVYQTVELRNDGDEPVEIVSYAYAVLRGFTPHDVEVAYDKRLGALIAWNRSRPELARIFGCSEKPCAFETTLDYAKSVSDRRPRPLSGKTDAREDPLGVLEHTYRMKPGETARVSYLLSFGDGRAGAIQNYRTCPDADEALRRTKAYYHDLLGRSVVLTPDTSVNRGVLWAKANMLRVQSKAPTGWCFVNDPTRSNNSVGRDTAWFGFGADYLDPQFAREALKAYVRLQEKSGMIVEYYDIRTGKTEDYGLNINDNTPLMIMALWHHYDATGDIDFLQDVYSASAKAGRYILSQRNEQGLVWCTATGTEDWGIVGWRNVIPNYRLSGATTEVNSECFAALETVSHMARVLEKHEESAEFAEAAEQLKCAINTHLLNPDNGLYYLNIDLDGTPRSDVTSDLVFPMMFGVADDKTSAAIISRLSQEDFWTTGGIRTTPRDSPMYTPSGGWGLLGGVWVAVSFWYAFAAAKYAPAFMAYALSTSFRNYSTDPRRNNTVPGQFSEWLNGETLVNDGMMLSPWFPPRYLWAAIEGVGGLDLSHGSLRVSARLAPDWKWMGVQNLPYRGERLTWLAVRVPEMLIYTNFLCPRDSTATVTYEKDITADIRATGESICPLGLQQGQNLLLFAGNTAERTSTTSISVKRELHGSYRLRSYNSLLEQWQDGDQLVTDEELQRGIMVTVERLGFCVLDLQQVV